MECTVTLIRFILEMPNTQSRLTMLYIYVYVYVYICLYMCMHLKYIYIVCEEKGFFL